MLAPFEPVEHVFALAARGHRTAAEQTRLRALTANLDVGVLFDAARANQVQHVVGDGLVREGLLAADGAWADDLATNAATKTRLFDAVHTASIALDSVGVPHALVESAGVATATSMPHRALGSGDVDMIVARGTLSRALQVFAASGFVPRARDGRTRTSRVELARPSEVGTLRVEVGEVTFERHWTPLPFPCLEDGWLNRRTTSPDGLPVLSASDLLVQVAIHTSMHSFVRAPGLRLYVDIDRVVRSGGVAWSDVLRQLANTLARGRAWLAFELAVELLGTPIPESVRSELRGHARTWALRTLMRSETVFERGRTRLPRAKALLLDLALEDGRPTTWVARNVMPSPDWLEREFGDGRRRSRASLQLARLRQATRAWQPR